MIRAAESHDPPLYEYIFGGNSTMEYIWWNICVGYVWWNIGNNRHHRSPESRDPPFGESMHLENRDMRDTPA